MPLPELYAEFAQEEAIARFGEGGAAQRLCDGQWVVLPEAILCFAVVGRAPHQSYFSSGSRFAWVAERPYQVSQELPEAVPDVVRAGRGERRPLFLFARLLASHSFTFLGELSLSHSFGMQDGLPGIASFELRRTLPSRLWRHFQGLDAGDEATQSLDWVLESLSQAASVEERLEVLERVIAYWNGSRSPEDGIPAAELCDRQLPVPLRWWYERYGRKEDLLSCPYALVPLAELETDESGKLVFLVEEEAVFLWATVPGGEDPSVWIQENEEGERWKREKAPLSVFLVQALLLAGLMRAPYGASTAWVDRRTLQKLRRALPPLPLPPWRWPQSPARFFGKDGAYMFVCPNGENEEESRYSVWIGARSEEPLQFLREIVDESWDYTAF